MLFEASLSPPTGDLGAYSVRNDFTGFAIAALID
jgi:hypothetical protein